jgi:hypothetical protein
LQAQGGRGCLQQLPCCGRPSPCELLADARSKRQLCVIGVARLPKCEAASDAVLHLTASLAHAPRPVPWTTVISSRSPMLDSGKRFTGASVRDATTGRHAQCSSSRPPARILSQANCPLANPWWASANGDSPEHDSRLFASLRCRPARTRGSRGILSFALSVGLLAPNNPIGPLIVAALPLRTARFPTAKHAWRERNHVHFRPLAVGPFHTSC